MKKSYRGIVAAAAAALLVAGVGSAAHAASYNTTFTATATGSGGTWSPTGPIRYAVTVDFTANNLFAIGSGAVNTLSVRLQTSTGTGITASKTWTNEYSKKWLAFGLSSELPWRIAASGSSTAPNSDKNWGGRLDWTL